MSSQPNKAVAVTEEKDNGGKRKSSDADHDLNVHCDHCDHCDNQPCTVSELDPMLISILQTYEGWKSNKQIRFRMYSDAIKSLHGTGLGKGVRKKLPSCLQRRIHQLVPDKEYTGFKATKEE